MRIQGYKIFLWVFVSVLLSFHDLRGQDVTIQEPVAATPIVCAGDVNGTITVSIDTSGGGVVAPFNYTIVRIFPATPLFTQQVNSSELSVTFTGLPFGTYVVAVEDANSIGDDTQTIVSNKNVVNTTLSGTVTQVQCFGAATGSFAVRGTGGTNSGYEFSATGPSFPTGSPFSTSNTFSNLLAGTYSVVARDANGCVDPTPLSVTINQPTQISISVTSQTNPLCAGNRNGSITVSATGGTPGYEYSINGGAFQTSPTFSGLPAGDYTITVRDSRGCEQPSSTLTLVDPPVLQIALDSQANILGCFGDETGEIRATASGGTGPYVYSIDGNNFVANGGVFTNLRAGTYNVTARDANGCTIPLAPVTLTQPLQLAVSLQSQTNIAGCFGDSTGVITVAATGGTGAYEYQLGSGAFQASPTFSGLGAGTYSVTVRDANGCTVVLNNVTLAQPTQLTIALGGSQNPLCNGSTNGAINVSANGGTGAYQYTLNGGAPQTSGSFTGLGAGSYTIVVTDANGCTATLPAVTLTEPAVLTLAVASQQDIQNCFGDSTGQITVAATGGTTAYEYSIDGGAFQSSAVFTGLRAGTYTITVRDVNGCTTTASATLNQPTLLTLAVQSQTDITGCFGETTGSATVAASGGTPTYQYSIDGGAFQASPSFTGLSAGGHTVTVRDDRGCTATVNFTLSQPTQLTASVASQTNVLCFGQNTGQITLSAGGGTPGYEYSLNNGAFQANSQFSNLPAGTYNIVVRDSRGCTVAINNVILSQPTAALALSAGTPQDVTCFGANDGAVSVTATGGATPYSFSTDGVNFVANGGVFTGLAPNTYAITVRDANGCTASVANVVVNQPAALQLTAAVTDVTCNSGNNGGFTVTATGGTPGFQYSIDGINFQPGATFAGLTAGNYTITVRDGRNCTATLSVNVGQPAALTLSASATDASCNGVSDGSATVNVSGGAAPYTYNWNTTPAQTTPGISGLAAGTYTVVVTDANGCQQTAAVTVGQPAAVVVPTAASPAPLCVGQPVPALTATGSNIRWYSDAALTVLVGTGSPFIPSIDNTTAGTTTFYVTQTVGSCQSQATVVTVVYNPSPAVPTISGTLAICTGGNTTLTSSATTGNQWFLNGNPIAGATGQTLAVSAAGDYTVQVTSGGCSATSVVATVTTANPSAPVASNPAPICVGGTIPTLTATGTNIRWYSDAALTVLVGSGSNFTPGIGNGTPGNTTFYATQTIGTCESPATAVTVSIIAVPSVPTISGALAFCVGGNTVLTSSATSGNQWYLNGNPIAGATGQTLTVSVAGNYTVEVAAGGCSAISAVAAVTETPVTTPTISGTLTFCVGGNTVLTSSATAGNQWLLNGNPIAGATAQTLAVSVAGNYSVQVTVGGGCSAISVPVSVSASDLAATLTVTNPTCGNPDSGEIAVNATGGRTPYEYSIDGTNFQSANVFANLIAGNYTVSIRDASGCLITRTQSVTAPSGISIVLGPASESGCNLRDGLVAVSVTGGTAPYQYFINGAPNPAGANNNTFTGLAPATYTIRVVDANGCEATDSTRVATTCVCSVAATVAATNVTSCTVTDGTIVVNNPTGGTAPYAYSIDGTNFQASAAFTGLAAGGYTVTVRDATGCTFTAPVTVGTDCLNCTLTASVATQADPTCAGTNNGVIALTATGGQGTVRYSIDNGVTFSTNPVFGGLPTGSYTILVTDTAGCNVNLGAVVLTAPAALTASAVSVNPTSCGATDGSLTVNTIGGTAPYRYSIDGANFQAGNAFSNLAPGSYTITVRDTNGCTITVTQSLVAPNSITSVAVNITAETACAANDGSLTVTPTGGTAPYRYFINGVLNPAGANSNVFANLAPGTYTIRVETADNCPFLTTATVGTLCVPPCVLTVTALPTAVNCHNGTDGQITVSATGGSGVYEYSLDGVNFQTAALFVSLAPNNYTITVRDRNNTTCQATANVTLTNPAILTGSAVITANPTCADNDGIVTVSASGGSGTLEYALNSGSYVANPVFSNLQAGTYIVTVRDANGCTLTLPSVTLVRPTNITATTASTNPTGCTVNDGSVTVNNVSGGVAPYEYSINGGTFQSTATFNGLAPGTYTVIVRDRNNCTLTLPVVTLAAPGGITASATVVHETSCRANDGQATVNVVGGTAPFQYFINGTLNPAGANNNIFTSLAPGSYNLRIVDANGCEFVLTATVNSFTCPPCAVVVSVDSQTTPTCASPNGGSVSVSATGGAAPYAYSLNGGAFQAAGNFVGLAAGTYSLVARDAAGCTDTVSVIITLPISITATVAGNNPTACNRSNGSIVVTNPTGGTSPYAYSLDGSNFSNTTGSFTGLASGNYTVTVRDANGCEAVFPIALTTPGGITSAAVTAVAETACRANDGTITVDNIVGAAGPYRYFINGRGNPAGVNNNVFAGLTPGSYTILVIAANDCRYSAVVAVGAATCGPVCTLAATLSYADPNCSAPNSGSATVSATGGTAPYQYSVNGGAFAAGTGSFQNLAPGRYDIVVRDANNCQVTLPPIQLIAPQGPNDILTSLTAPSGCTAADARIIATNVAGGTVPYQYSIDGTNFGADNTFRNLTAGTYTIYVRDAKQCVYSETVTIALPGGISATAVAANETACNARDGRVTVNVTGASGAVEYLINGVLNPAGANNNVFTSLAPGNYSVLVRDAAGCQFTVSVTVGAFVCPPCTLTATAASTQPTCAVPNSGSVTVSVSNGSAPYQYSINGGTFTSGSGIFSGLAAGTYTIIVRDANGCDFTVPTVTLVLPTITLTVSGSNLTGCTTTDGVLTASVSGGVAPYAYSLDGTNFTNTTGTFTGLAAGSYTVFVRDANGCVTNTTQTLTAPNGITAATLTPTNETACSAANGIVAVSGVTGGAAPYAYSLNGGTFQATATFNGLAPGNYTVVVRDANGCTFTASVTVGTNCTATCTVVASVSSQTNPTCALPNSGSVNVSATGGAAPYAYSLDGGAFQTAGNFAGLTAGSYSVVARDAAGCTDTVSVTIVAPVSITATVTGNNPTACSVSDGTVSVNNVTGGTAPYQYAINGGAPQASSTFSGLGAGTYSISVTDANGCATMVSASLSAPSGITATAAVTDETACRANDGTVSVTVGNASGAVQYFINGTPNPSGPNNSVFTGLAPNTYTILVRDGAGCEFVAAATVAAFNCPTCTLAASVSGTNVTACGRTDGTITVMASGGQAPYAYSLDGVTFTNTTGVFSGLDGGNYTITIRDAANCVITRTRSVSAPSGISATVLSAASESGCNRADGIISVDAITGGTAPYQYFINGALNPAGANNHTFTGLRPATYTIRIVDAVGCEFTDSIRVATTCVCSLAATVTGTDVTACGRSDGRLAIRGTSGGTTPYAYSIDGTNFQADSVFAGLVAGAYTVTVRDAAGCVVTFTQTISAPSGFTASLATVNETACRANDGRVTVSVVGGTAPFQYFINGTLNPAGANNNVFASLAPGSYNLRVTDAAGCEFVLAATVGAFTCPPPLCTIMAQAFANPVLCNGISDGSAILVNITGGSGSYEFSIDNGATFQANPQFNNLAAGTYNIQVRDRNQPTCTATFPVSVTTRFDVAGIIIVNQPRACGERGRITFTNVFGGQAPYRFSVDGTTFVTDTVFNDLQPGRYRATIRDSRGCQFSAEINVIGGQAIVATVNQGQAATCNRSDGSIVISNVSGGSGTFVYSLDGTNFSGTTTFANLAAGAYTVYIREQNGTCVATFPVTVASTACCQLAVTPTATQPTGCSSTDGRIELAVTNGTAPFTYRLNNGAFQNNNVFSGLGNGGYTVTVRDATGCESVVAVSLAAPNALSAQTEQVTPASCFGRADGRVRVFNVTGGSNNIDNYEYSINGGTFQNSALFSGLRAGVYLLTVRDKSNGCVASYPVTVSEAAQIVATVTPTNPTACAVRDGRIAIGNVTGGVGPYEYSLDSLTGYQVTPQFSNLGNGTFRVYVRDSRGCLAVYPIRLGSPNAVNVGTPTLVNPTCQGSNNGEITMGAVTGGQAPYQFNLNGGPYQTSGSFTGLRAGTFTVNVRDQTGCEYPFTYVLTEPATIVFEVRQTKDATCADPTGSVEVTGLLGGTPPYRYSLNGTDFQSSPIFENLEPNDYIMYVRDVSRNTCASSKPFTVRGARSVTFELTTSNIGCSNTERGSIIIHGIRGGIEVGSPVEYDISINGGRTFRSVTTDSVAFTDLEAGLYDIVIGYGANCRTAARRVTINAGSVPFDVTTTPATCGASNGSATATIANPIPGKTYYYSIDSLNFFTTPNFVNLRAGTYRMYLRESINDVCSNIRTFVVAGPDSVRYEIQRDSCNKVVVANLRGGVAPYVVTLEGRENRTSGAIFANEFVLRNLPDGEYTLQVTDAAGCRTRPFNFRVGNRVTFKTKTTPSVIEQPTGGVLIYDIANGQPPYSVSVDGQNWAVVKDRSIPIDTLVTGLPVGLATVWVRDANGCEQKTIVEIEELKFVVPNIFTPNGDGVNDTFFITKLPAGTFVKIVDRWGRVVYETRDYKNEWDGGTYPDGVYYYTIDIAGEKTYRGWVQIWR